MKLLQSWTIEFHSGIPAYKQIIHHVQAAVANGLLKEGDQLPSIREVHEALTLNPNTVAKAYRELALMGVIATAKGSGCFVSAPAEANPKPKSSRQKSAKLKELCSRFAAEARSHGLSLQDIVNHCKR